MRTRIIGMLAALALVMALMVAPASAAGQESEFIPADDNRRTSPDMECQAEGYDFAALSITIDGVLHHWCWTEQEPVSRR